MPIGKTPMSLLEKARRFEDDLVALRRDLHRHPELAYQEERTAAEVASRLRALGYAVRTGVARTGVVADLDAGEGPRVALRADMDALPIQEENPVPYASTVPGVMHACGHDAHTSALVGAARLLAEAAETGTLPPGRIRLLFQPAEEAVDEDARSGARRMVEEGAMKGVDAVAGMHVGAQLPVGRVFLRPGAVFAGSNEFVIQVKGVSAHGARPDQGIDAIVLAAQGVMAAQQVVSRRIDPLDSGVLSFGTIRGGRAMNILADEVELTGTLRYFRPEVGRRLREGLEAAFGAVDAMGGQVVVDVRPGYPPVVNHPAATRTVRRELEELMGPGGVVEIGPTVGAEDFSFLAREAPGVFFWVGAALPDAREHHHPRFDLDEACLPVASAALAAAATSLLADPPRDPEPEEPRPAVRRGDPLGPAPAADEETGEEPGSMGG